MRVAWMLRMPLRHLLQRHRAHDQARDEVGVEQYALIAVRNGSIEA